ncbi:hypothetical protein [Methanoregula boonei]|jgi:hypothetical protein|uniref:hypothetical protein n=1 Tax=Methanoregula boonei TaxID=358766 RepID=UPI0012F9EB72|nr:hypothetical protein [Methanoregula boonei]
MCIGNTCGGMTETTIYSAASGNPTLFVAGAAAVAAGIVLVLLLVKYNIIPLKGIQSCHGIAF